MTSFVATLIILLLITVFIQLVKNMKIVGGNELGIKSGVGGEKGFSMITGGRLFIIPLIHKFSKIDLTPTTIEVVVDSAIAEGIVPLNVKATVSFAVASNQAGRRRAATRILEMTRHWDQLRKVASDIIEGHLRDAIATMTPEQVMQDKDTLVSRMINVCKSDLENIGLEITTMNIADVDDHRLEGVDEPDLYIALLKRIQTTNAETKARKARAESRAKSQEAAHARRAEVEVRQLENEYEELVAQTRLRVREEKKQAKIGIEQATRDATAQAAGLRAEIAAEKERIEMLRKKYAADIITPAETERDRMIFEARQQSAHILGKAQGELDELAQTIQILKEGGDNGLKAYLIENFESIVSPFAQTLSNFPVRKLSVISGAGQSPGPISAVHPNAIDQARNQAIAAAFTEVFEEAEEVEQSKKPTPPTA